MERKQFSLQEKVQEFKAAGQKIAWSSARMLMEDQDPRAQQMREVFDEGSLRFAHSVDKKFFRFGPEFSANANAVIENVEEGLVPVILGIRHGGYVTGPLTAKAASVIVENTNLEGFYLTLAKTLMDGKQGLPAYMSYHGWRPYLEEHYMEALPTIRWYEVDDYTHAENTATALYIGRRILGLFRPGNKKGLLMFPEGGMDSGRSPAEVIKGRKAKQLKYPKRKIPDLEYTPNNDKVAGIQKITDIGVIETLIRFIEDKRPFQLWLTTTKGDETLASPTTKSVPIPALADFMYPVGKQKLYAELTAFPPIRHDNLVARIAAANNLRNDRGVVVDALKANPDMLFDHIAGHEVAPYIDWYLRGYYDVHATKVLEMAGRQAKDKLPIPQAGLPEAA